MKRDDCLVALDIGTSKICMIIAEKNLEGGLDIIGYGQCSSNGLRKGVVVNIEKTIKSIQKAGAQAELMAGIKPTRVVVGIAGDHIKGMNSRGVIAVSSRDKVITQSDVDRVVDAARAVVVPMDRRLLHIIPQEFIVNDQHGIKDPVGVSGVRLEAEVHLVTGSVSSIQNIARSVNRAGYDVSGLVLEPLASSYAVLSEDEKELGAAVIDIGGGTTDIIIYSGGVLKYTGVLALGGDHVTHDIAVGLCTPMKEAERIKIANSCCYASSLEDKDIEIDVPSVGGRRPRSVSRTVLNEIVEPRMEELFNLCTAELARSGCEEMLSAGIVLTGGASLVKGAQELATNIFERPVRIGYPCEIGGLKDAICSPKYATSVGLLMYAGEMENSNKDYSYCEKTESGLFGWMFSRIREMFVEAFA